MEKNNSSEILSPWLFVSYELVQGAKQFLAGKSKEMKYVRREQKCQS